jgi:hypothetical protein
MSSTTIDTPAGSLQDDPGPAGLSRLAKGEEKKLKGPEPKKRTIY